MIRLIAIPLIALTLQGCILDKLQDPSKPSEAQQAMLDRQALFTPETPEVETEQEPAPAPAYTTEGPIVAAPVAAPAPSPPPSQCFEVFRINRCSGETSVDWFYGDAPEAPEPVVVAEVLPEPVVVPVPVVQPPKPHCVAVFRVMACSDDGEEIWL